MNHQPLNAIEKNIPGRATTREAVRQEGMERYSACRIASAILARIQKKVEPFSGDDRVYPAHRIRAVGAPDGFVIQEPETGHWYRYEPVLETRPFCPDCKEHKAEYWFPEGSEICSTCIEYNAETEALIDEQ